jgi:hypothetical protein
MKTIRNHDTTRCIIKENTFIGTDARRKTVTSRQDR